MKILTVTITEDCDDGNTPMQFPIQHYKRRVELDDIALVIERLDQSLSIKPRRQRSDKGSTRNPQP